MGNDQQGLEGIFKRHPQLPKQFEQQNWRLIGKRFTPEWEQIISLISRTQIKQLVLAQTSQPLRIMHLTHIQFDKLVCLYLGSNSITSVEDLKSLRAPFLRGLYLNDNLLTRLRSLKKCQFPLLNALGLNENPLVEVESLAQMQADIKQLYLQNDDNKAVGGEDLVWISRLPKLLSIEVQTPTRIKREQFIKMLIGGSPELRVFTFSQNF